MDQEEAQKQYVEILRGWPGYGSTLFDVEVRNPTLSAKMSREIQLLFVACRGWEGVFGVSSSDYVMFLRKTFLLIY